MRISDWSSDVCSSDLGDSSIESSVLRKPDLAPKDFKEMGPLERVHDRTLHLRKVQAHSGVGKPVVDRLKALESRSIDVIHGRANQDEVLQLLMFRHLPGHELPQPARFQIGQALSVSEGPHPGT